MTQCESSDIMSNFMRCWKPCVQTAREEGIKGFGGCQVRDYSSVIVCLHSLPSLIG